MIYAVINERYYTNMLIFEITCYISSNIFEIDKINNSRAKLS